MRYPVTTKANRIGIILSLLCLTVLFPRTVAAQHSHGSPNPLIIPCDTVSNLPPFLDRLPLPPRARPVRTNGVYCVPALPSMCFSNVPEYDIHMTNVMHYFHTNLPPVEVWGYEGMYPGPTFDVNTNEPIVVNWINNLPATYPSWLPADTNLHGVMDQTVRSVVHLHGGASLARYDGYPTNWYVRGESDQYFYGNIDLSETGDTLWYHDHAVGVTANNVYAGLAGFYFLRAPGFETNLNLPKDSFEIPLVLQDRDIQTNCGAASLYLGFTPWHSLMVVNGKVTPYFEIEPRRYRFRILNGTGFRTLGLTLMVTDTNGTVIPGGPTPPPFYVIGNESGFLPKTVVAPSTNSLAMMPGERVDVIIDFTSLAGRNLTMINGIDTDPNLAGKLPSPPYITNMMQFRVNLPLSSPDTSSIPGQMITNWVDTTNMICQAVVNREITLDLANEQPLPGLPFNTNDYPFALLNMSFFHDPVTEMPHAGDTEIWSFINLSAMAHPMHIHLLDFRVIDRTRFAGWNGNPANPPTTVTNYINDRANNTLRALSYYLSTNSADIQTVKPFEGGNKDVVRVAPFSVTRVVLRWPTNPEFYSTSASPSGDPGSRGDYIYHCHILDHEDNDMMRPLKLLPPYQPTLLALLDPTVNIPGFNHFRLGFESRSNEAYRLESTTNLTFPNWSNILSSDVVGTNGPILIVPPPAMDRERYYRLLPIEVYCGKPPPLLQRPVSK